MTGGTWHGFTVASGSNSQQRQDPIVLGATETEIGHAGYRSEGYAAQSALITGLAARRTQGSLPAEAVGDHHERTILGNECEVADGNKRVLQARRDH